MANTQKYLNHLLQTVGITPACSEEEREAADEIARIFSNHGFDPEIQEFTSSASLKTMRAILCCVMFVAAILMGIGGMIGVVGTILVFASGILFVLERFGRISFPQVGAGGLSQNVIAYHKASGPLASPRNRPVVVIAHYDSPRGDILASGPLAAYRPLLVKLLPFTMAAPVIIAVVRLFPLPEPAKLALWVMAIVVSLIPLLNGVAIMLNRFALPYTSGSVCNKSSVAAMLGVMDAVSPFAGRDEFPGDVPFDEYMDEQRSMYAVDEYDEGAVPPIPTGERVEDEYAPEDEALIEQPIEQLPQESVGYEDDFGDEVADTFEPDYDEMPLEGDTVAMPALDYADRIEVESAAVPAVSADEAPAIEAEPVVEESEPEPEEPGLPVNDAGCIRYGVDALRSLGMVASSCAIEYEEGALPVLASVADKVVSAPAVEQVSVEPVRPVADVPSPEKPVQDVPHVERQIETPVAPVVVPPVAPEVVPVVTAPADQMDNEVELPQYEEPIDEVAAAADETVAFAAQTDDVSVDQDEVDTDVVDPFAGVPDMEQEPIDDQIDWAYHENAELEEEAELEELDDIEDIDGAIEAEFELLDDDQFEDESAYDLENGFVSDEDTEEPVDEDVVTDDGGEVLDASDAVESIVEDIDEPEFESDAIEFESEEIEDGQDEFETAYDEVVSEEDTFIEDEAPDAVEGFVEGDEEFDLEQDEGVDAAEFDGDEAEDDDFYEGATQEFQAIGDEELGERIETETLVYDQFESDEFESPETEDANEVYDEAEYVDETELVDETEEEFEVEPDIMEALYEVIDDEEPTETDDEDEFVEGEGVQLDATTEFVATEEEPVDEDSIDVEPAEDEADDVEAAEDEFVDEQLVADEEESVDEQVIDDDDVADDVEPEVTPAIEQDEPEEDGIDRSVPLGGTTQAFDVSTLIQGTQPFVEQPLDATLPRTQETVDSLMDQISTEPAARPRRSLNIPDISSTSPYIPRTVPPNVPDIDPAPRTIASAVQQQKSGSIASRSTLFDLPDPSASAADPLANVGATGSMRATSGSTSQFTVIGPNDVVPPSAPAPGTFETISAPAPQPKKKKRGLGGLFGRKKKREESSMSDWLGVDDDYDAKRSGRDIGSWDNFEGDDGWKGGATGDASLTEAELREAITSMGDDELLGHDIWFVATGSSEHANAGARAFLESHRDKLRGVFLINLECVGSGMLAMLATEGERRVLKGDKRIMGLVSRVSSDFHHEIASVDMPFVDTDAHAAMEMSLRALTIAGVDGVNFACSHGAEDVPVNIDAGNVELTAEVVTEVIRRS